MAPQGNRVETPDSVEQEQPTEIKPEKPAEPPFTEEERLTEQAGNINETLKDLRPAAQQDKTDFDQLKETGKKEEPPMKITGEPLTVEEVQDLEGKQQAIQRQLDNAGPETANEPPSAEEPAAEPAERQAQPQSKIPEGPKPEKGKVEEQPKAEIRPRLPHEAPVEQLAAREQTAEQLQKRLAAALDKVYNKIEANGGKLPEDLVAFDEVKNIFNGSRVVSENTVNSQIEQLKQNFTNFQRDNGRAPSREEFKGLGTKALREQLGLLAQENPQEVKKSPFEKQQAERDASHQPGRSPDVPVQANPMPPETEDKSRASNRE